MKLAHLTTRAPHLVRALEALALRQSHDVAAYHLAHELAGVTVLVARKFTNDRTADGMLEAFYLTTGCVSLGIAEAEIAHDAGSELDFLLHQGAEQVFQAGFRCIRELASLPSYTLVFDFDSDPVIGQRNIKALFSELCRAEPTEEWTGHERYRNALRARRANQSIIDCAKWLRKHHYAGAIRSTEMDAAAVIDIAVMFAMLGDGRIVARAGHGEIEELIRRARENRPDVEAGWEALLGSVPPACQAILRESMDKLKKTLIRKILSKTAIKTVILYIEKNVTGAELEVAHP